MSNSSIRPSVLWLWSSKKSRKVRGPRVESRGRYDVECVRYFIHVKNRSEMSITLAPTCLFVDFLKLWYCISYENLTVKGVSLILGGRQRTLRDEKCLTEILILQTQDLSLQYWWWVGPEESRSSWFMGDVSEGPDRIRTRVVGRSGPGPHPCE